MFDWTMSFGGSVDGDCNGDCAPGGGACDGDCAG
jgi:hypothetical protein